MGTRFGFSISLGSDGSISVGEIEKTSRPQKGKSMLKFSDSYSVVDLETTGLDPNYDDIIEVAAIRVEKDQEIDSFSSLINPGYQIDESVIAIHGITNEMLADAPNIEEVLPKLMSFIGDSIVVGHNVNFDVNFLYDSCMRHLDKPFENDFIDTLRLSRRLFPELPNHKLQTLVQYLQISDQVAHRSLSDAHNTFECYTYMHKYVVANNEWAKLELKKNSSFLKAKDIKATTDNFNEYHPLYNKTCVFTGTLEKMVRRDAMQIVVNFGGFCADSVTKKTDYLVLGNNDYCSSIKEGKSSKQKKAEQLKLSGYPIEILSENVFYDMISDFEE